MDALLDWWQESTPGRIGQVREGTSRPSRKSRVPAGPVTVTVTGPFAGSKTVSNLRNRQHRRSAMMVYPADERLVTRENEPVAVLDGATFARLANQANEQIVATRQPFFRAERAGNGQIGHAL
jgi:hypothetical protein